MSKRRPRTLVTEVTWTRPGRSVAPGPMRNPSSAERTSRKVNCPASTNAACDRTRIAAEYAHESASSCGPESIPARPYPSTKSVSMPSAKRRRSLASSVGRFAALTHVIACTSCGERRLDLFKHPAGVAHRAGSPPPLDLAALLPAKTGEPRPEQRKKLRPLPCQRESDQMAHGRAEGDEPEGPPDIEVGGDAGV